MKKIILVAGATGNLGHKIVKALLKKDVHVRAIVRTTSKQEDVDKLEQLGAEVIKADWNNETELEQACNNVSCVVSALAGLRDVIVDAQSKLLDAAIAAGVPRFIPSDFSPTSRKYQKERTAILICAKSFMNTLMANKFSTHQFIMVHLQIYLLTTRRCLM